MARPSGFFQGSELPRLLFLAAVMIVGWVLGLELRPEADQSRRARAHGRRASPSRSSPDQIASNSRRSPIERRSNSATTRPIRCCSTGPRPDARRARRRGPPRRRAGPSLAEPRSSTGACRSTCWAPPCACCAIHPSSAQTAGSTKRGSSRRKPRELPYVCVFEDAPEGFPIGPNVSERVVFNGYFLKIMKYQAADVARGAPSWSAGSAGTPREAVLRGRIELEPCAGRSSSIGGHVLHLPGSLDLPAPPALHRAQRSRLAELHTPPKRSIPPRSNAWASPWPDAAAPQAKTTRSRASARTRCRIRSTRASGFHE